MSREVLKALSDKLSELEDQGLENTDEYEEISDEYQSLSLSMLPMFADCDIEFVLCVYHHGDVDSTKYDTYTTWEEASEVGDELVEEQEIEDYEIITSDEYFLENE